MEKSMWLEKLYEETVEFMEKFSINENVSVDDRRVVEAAYNNVNRDLHEIVSREELPEEISESYKSKVEQELSDVVHQVSDLTIKDAYLRHLSDSNLSLQKEETLSSSIEEYMNLTKQKNKLASGYEPGSIFDDLYHILTNRQHFNPHSHDHNDSIEIISFDEYKQQHPIDLRPAQSPIPEEFSFGADPEWMRQHLNGYSRLY